MHPINWVSICQTDLAQTLFYAALVSVMFKLLLVRKGGIASVPAAQATASRHQLSLEQRGQGYSTCTKIGQGSQDYNTCNLQYALVLCLGTETYMQKPARF